MTLILKILTQPGYSGNSHNAELFTALGESERKVSSNEGGLGTVFNKRQANVPDAFEFDDLKKTVVVKNIEELKLLADKSFAAGSKKQGICLALLIANEKTSTELRSQCVSDLKKIYDGGSLKKATDKKDTLAKLDEILKNATLTVSSTPAVERSTPISTETEPNSHSSSTASDTTFNVVMTATATPPEAIKSDTDVSLEEEKEDKSVPLTDELHVPVTSQPTTSHPIPTQATAISTLSEEHIDPDADTTDEPSISAITSSSTSAAASSTSIPSTSSSSSSSAHAHGASSSSSSTTAEQDLHEVLTTKTVDPLPPSSLSPSSSSDVNTSTFITDQEKIDQLLEAMVAIKDEDSIKITKAAQSENFINALKDLTAEQLEELNLRMNEVQTGKKQDEKRFDTIRKERYFVGHGNTATWQRMRHEVKAYMLKNLEEKKGYDPKHPEKKAKLSQTEFKANLNQFNQHTSHLGRFFCFFKTSTAKKFTHEFETNKPRTIRKA